MTLTEVGQTLKDFYPLPGTRIKQYVVDTRRELDWEEATCPRVHVDEHEHDNDGEVSAFGGECRWSQLIRYGCESCDALYEKLQKSSAVVAWLAEKAARPPIEPDHAKPSDEIAPEWPAMREHPMFSMIKKPTKKPR